MVSNWQKLAFTAVEYRRYVEPLYQLRIHTNQDTATSCIRTPTIIINPISYVERYSSGLQVGYCLYRLDCWMFCQGKYMLVSEQTHTLIFAFYLKDILIDPKTYGI